MKIIHQNGYTPEELSVFRLVVYKNLVDSAKDIIPAMKKIGVDCVEGINRVCRFLSLSFFDFWGTLGFGGDAVKIGIRCLNARRRWWSFCETD